MATLDRDGNPLARAISVDLVDELLDRDRLGLLLLFLFFLQLLGRVFGGRLGWNQNFDRLRLVVSNGQRIVRARLYMRFLSAASPSLLRDRL